MKIRQCYCMSCQRSSNHEIKPAKTLAWHTGYCICLWRLKTSLGRHAFTISQSRIANSSEIHTHDQRVALNRSSAQPPWELLLCAGVQYWLNVRVMATSVENYCSSSTLLFVVYLFINYCYHFFLTGTIRRWSLSLKNGGFKVDVLWHSGCVCLEFTRCCLVSPKARELQVPLFHLASNYSIRFRLA